MAAFKELTGQTFGELYVLCRAPNNKHGGTMWFVTCNCPEMSKEAWVVHGSSLLAGKTISCGHVKRQRMSQRLKEANTTHGMCGTREYKAWKNMIARCKNPNSTSYQRYGGRGTDVCDSWRKSFDVFFSDMGPAPPGMTLERKDNALGYFKENCCWDTTRVQAIHRGMFKNNTSGYRGVKEIKKGSGRWYVQLKNHGRCFTLGYYSSREEAADSYNFMACLLHGEHAQLNQCIPPFSPSREHPLLQFLAKYPDVIPSDRLPQLLADLESRNAA